MYHASELFIIKDVLDIYTQQKHRTMNACEVLPASSQRQQMLVDQKVKKFTEFYHVHLQCMTAGSSRMSLAKRLSIWLQKSYLNFFQLLSPPSSIIK